MSDKTETFDGTLRLRIVDLSGTIFKKTIIKIDPLVSNVYQKLPLVELSGANAPDWSTLVGVADLRIDGHNVSTILVYFVPPEQVKLRPASVAT